MARVGCVLLVGLGAASLWFALAGDYSTVSREEFTSCSPADYSKWRTHHLMS